MKLSEIKLALSQIDKVEFSLPNGQAIPNHFHVTEVGLVQKHFIDCGGTARKESSINFQLWTADDHDHRLSAKKLSSIIAFSESKLGLEDLEIEVEYQGDTIGKYGLGFDGNGFLLISKQTDCLAKDNCGIPQPKSALVAEQTSCCSPASGCC